LKVISISDALGSSSDFKIQAKVNSKIQSISDEDEHEFCNNFPLKVFKKDEPV
jgi:hypothetical protein